MSTLPYPVCFMRCWPKSFCILLAATASCRPDAASDTPEFVERLVSQFESSPVTNPPGSIWRYKYKGQDVYYVPPSCCDIPGELYDGNGEFICAPDGGITGTGDGNCPDFFSERSEPLRVWADER